ncbi:hypothetical protein FJ872_18275 [Mesorhizobium sp. B2-5-9]|uniref:FMN-dependent NADH-azoreductase n=1 Tax=Mesorhizobium sp. B2-5-9 TaxID=2589921 RepID=UPI00112DC202|nr:NAD(P)H-dependent oxidoreductase [Mesorhizobium sp. B2-5-9]TPK16742.1 hypothetical protein FJ872_18275 [Mesorhizobium sp. B2-5-9]
MNILHIDVSPRQESRSRQLSAAIVEKVLEVAPGASITRRDLGAEPLPHTVAPYAAALASPATLAAPPRGSLDISEALIEEVEAADVIVMGTPMYNFSIPSVLKAWIDQICVSVARCSRRRPGRWECCGTVRCLSASPPVASFPATEPTNPIFSRRI